MTSREATQLLPLPARTAQEWRRTPAELVDLIAFGAIQWPWLLKSLWGGRRRDKAALLDRLGLAPDALPNLGSWKADVGFLMRITDHILTARPEYVVELGAGASTLVAARALQLGGGGSLTSFDQHHDFVEATHAWLTDNGLSVDLHHAPLIPAPSPWPALWYGLDALPERIDLLLIDGPPWTLHPLVRGAAETLFDRIPIGGVVMLDDAARPGERVIARRWRQAWPGFEFRLKPGIKGTLVGRRLS